MKKEPQLAGPSSNHSRSQPRLRGRSRECAALEQLVTDVRSGMSRTLVLRGEAGVGKTALLDNLLEHTVRFRALRVGGVESDMELAYAGLQQLCAPLADYLDELPTPQRDALEVAFGRGSGPAPDRFLVGLAVLSLISAAAEDQPVVCVVDDAQWVDHVSMQTLTFVGRRLMAEPVALLFAVRDGVHHALSGLPELPVNGLPDSDAREFLDSIIPGRLDGRVRDRIVAESRGNPLALQELPGSHTTAELAGGFPNPRSRPLTSRIELSFVRRVEALPAATQRLVLAAAAEPIGDPALLLRVADLLGIPADALAPAEAAGLLEMGSRVRFCHPLLRSAVYRTADLGERRAVHRALARATPSELDPDRQAWHAANAATGPDDAVATALEASAGRAQRRGGMVAAAAFLERATALTSDAAQRGARALAAAQAKWDAAEPIAAYDLLAAAELGPLTRSQSARVARLRAQMDFVRSRCGDEWAPPLTEAAAELISVAHQLEVIEDESARESYLQALAATMYAGRLGDPHLLPAAAKSARAAVRASTPNSTTDLLLDGIATRITDGPGGGRTLIYSALEDLAQHHHSSTSTGRDIWLAFPVLLETAAYECWDDGMWHQLTTRAVHLARESGALAVLPQALVCRAGAHVQAGEFTAAAALIEEADSITASTGYASVKYHSLTLAAWRGVATEATELIDAATVDGTARQEGRVLGLTGYAAAVLYNGLGRYDEAFAAAGRACDYEDLGLYGWSLLELIEAASRCEEHDAAKQGLRQLEERTFPSGTDWALGALAGAGALLADDQAAESLYLEAIERFGRTRIVVHLARARLRYGEWLRRVNRRVDARVQLSAAHDMFTRMGAQAFAERARRELLATGEKARKRPLRSGDDLTAQEAQIARLAAEGLTNQEIGAQLFISTHTVEWHLRKVFVKLGITSRRQLRSMSWAG
ncbi:LuxR family transcriptional regulator [Mycobacterium sp. 21AC1]|uniref:helix-turn-helix transcriptional regulator n=1 Tax=[Mycobacterium] appelbergii TaxID=2939269 RepID=UPI00293934CF|nr:LuxR family transcriptional regulator [Mycobacterium sp. 21AC1]MDV3130091.1 LuxR family transcriptional regulator [Mycobacterium sp. 21AC1]